MPKHSQLKTLLDELQLALYTGPYNPGAILMWAKLETYEQRYRDAIITTEMLFTAEQHLSNQPPDVKGMLLEC